MSPYRTRETPDIRIERWWQTALRRWGFVALVCAVVFAFSFTYFARHARVSTLYLGWIAEGFLVMAVALFRVEGRSHRRGLTAAWGIFAALVALSVHWCATH